MRHDAGHRGDSRKWMVPAVALAAALGFTLLLMLATSGRVGSGAGASPQLMIMLRRNGTTGAGADGSNSRGALSQRLWDAGRGAFGVGSGGGGNECGSRKPGKGLDCAAGCKEHGTCDRDLGVCRCPFGRTGGDCAALALAACRRADAPDAPMHCAWTWGQDTPPAVSCECHRQCVAHLEALGDEADLKNDLQDPEQVLCYERTGAPPEAQLSAFPAEDEQNVSYFRGSDPAKREVVGREDVARRWRYWEGGNLLLTEALPPAVCPGACSARGTCLRVHPFIPEGEALTPPSDPHCRCQPGLQGDSCGEAAAGGTATHACPRNCSGAGACDAGFCRCAPGRWGADCGRSQAFPPAPRQPSQRLRIYIYELPPALAEVKAATMRGSELYHGFQYLLHSLRGDWAVRTEDPTTASLFYVPALTLTYAGNVGIPVLHAATAVDWVRTRFPYWNASGGADHILFWPGDHGYVNRHGELDPYGEDYRRLDAPIKLTHFCFLGPGGASDLRAKYGGNSPAGGVFSPSRDVCAMPLRNLWAQPDATETYVNVTDTPESRADPETPPLGNRNTLLYFRGSLRVNEDGSDADPLYSGGARQAMFRHHAHTDGIRFFHQNAQLEPPHRGDAVEMRDSQFCFCPSGHGFGMRVSESMLHGCIPVIVQDDMVAHLESVLPYEQFSVRLPQCEIPRIAEILRSIPKRDIVRMQWGMVDWHRAFIYDAEPPEQGAEPYGLAYNWTIAALERSWAAVRTERRLAPGTPLTAWRHATALPAAGADTETAAGDAAAVAGGAADGTASADAAAGGAAEVVDPAAEAAAAEAAAAQTAHPEDAAADDAAHAAETQSEVAVDPQAAAAEGTEAQPDVAEADPAAAAGQVDPQAAAAAEEAAVAETEQPQQ